MAARPVASDGGGCDDGGGFFGLAATAARPEPAVSEWISSRRLRRRRMVWMILTDSARLVGAVAVFVS